MPNKFVKLITATTWQAATVATKQVAVICSIDLDSKIDPNKN